MSSNSGRDLRELRSKALAILGEMICSDQLPQDFRDLLREKLLVTGWDEIEMIIAPSSLRAPDPLDRSSRAKTLRETSRFACFLGAQRSNPAHR